MAMIGGVRARRSPGPISVEDSELAAAPRVAPQVVPRVARLLELQRTAGNRAVADLLGSSPVVRRAVQRRKEPGQGSTEGGVYSDGPAEPAAPALTAAERLSGAHWKGIADANWPNSNSLSDLESSFSSDLLTFISVLGANGIGYEITAGLRPPQRSYLFHYSVEVSKGRVAPDAVPAEPGVDINWDHGDDDASKAAAEAMVTAFGIVGIAAHPSNHNGGTAVDMKLDFSGNSTNTLSYTLGTTPVTRTIKTDDEARVGVLAKGKSIASIGTRELSKAGADFGVKRALDRDIVHWSRTGN